MPPGKLSYGKLPYGESYAYLSEHCDLEDSMMNDRYTFTRVAQVRSVPLLVTEALGSFVHHCPALTVAERPELYRPHNRRRPGSVPAGVLSTAWGVAISGRNHVVVRVAVKN